MNKINNWYLRLLIANKQHKYPILKNKKIKAKYDGWSCFVISGQQLRDKVAVQFYAGGNAQAYPQIIPYQQFWIQDIDQSKGQLQKEDMTAILVHQLVQFWHMKQLDLTYDQAHKQANKWQKQWRDQNYVGIDEFFADCYNSFDNKNQACQISVNLIQQFINNL